MLTSEEKKIVAKWMYKITLHEKWLPRHMGTYSDYETYDHIDFDLNDAGLVAKEMQKRGELYIFLTWIDNNLPYKEWSNFIAWIFNPDNFFSAFVEWRKEK